MLISLSILLARAYRRKKAIPLVVVSNPQIIVGVVKAVEASNGSAVLVIEDSISPSFETETLYANAIHLAQKSTASLAVVISAQPTKEAVSTVLNLEIPAITFNLTYLSKKALWEITRWTVREAKRKNTEVMGTVSGLATVDRLYLFVEQTEVDCLSFPIGIKRDGQPHISASYVSQIAKAARIPLVAQEFPLSRAALKQCAQAGLTAFTLKSEIEEAYTAGLRTGLRGHSQNVPSSYESLGIKAVEQTISNYLKYT